MVTQTIIDKIDTEMWRKEVETKSSIKLYRECKTQIKEEQIYDNTPASITFFRCRSNTLNLKDRKRFEGGDTKCVCCSEEYENLEHFILYCEEYQEIRNNSREFDRPYEEEVLKKLLFENNKSEEIKRTIQKFWIKRQKKIQQQ